MPTEDLLGAAERAAGSDNPMILFIFGAVCAGAGTAVLLGYLVKIILKIANDKGANGRSEPRRRVNTPERLEREDSTTGQIKGITKHIWEEQIIDTLNDLSRCVNALLERINNGPENEALIKAISELRTERKEFSKIQTMHGDLLYVISGDLGTIKKQSASAATRSAKIFEVLNKKENTQ